MQGDACCVLFELFVFNKWVFSYGGTSQFASFARGQAGQNPYPS
jgi:hypothetical protein